jgi:hypothetical protein
MKQNTNCNYFETWLENYRVRLQQVFARACEFSSGAAPAAVRANGKSREHK